MKTVHVADTKKLAGDSGFETVDLTVDTSGLVHLMSLLTNLYSSPRTAVLREYVSNAIDSHVKAGDVTRPIELTIPTYNSANRNLVVRDYGVGMSKDEIVNVYSRYGNSTKRDNNDEIGGFGLGAKSALALSSRFDIVSIKDGIEVKFYIEKNFQGAGVVHFVHELPTSEPAGVEVSIPYVYGEGFWKKELDNFFVGVPKGMLKINGVLFEDTLDNDKLFQKITGIDEDIATGWFSKAEPDSDSGLIPFGVMVGGVSYAIPYKAYSSKKVDELTRFNRSVYANLPIGSIDLTPSREELIYSPKTVAVLDATIDALHSGIETFISSELNAIDEISRAFHYVWFRRNHFWNAKNLKWRGQTVPLEYSFEAPVYSITAPTLDINGKPRSASNMELIAGGGQDIKNRLLREDFTVVLSDVANPLNVFELKEEARLIRRYSRSIRSATDRRGILLISSKKDFDNNWVAISHRKDIRTSTDLINIAKAYATNQRKLAKDAGVVKVKETKPVAQLISFKKGNTSYFVEKIFAGDARLTPKDPKKVLYVKQNEHYAIFPNPYWEEDQVINEIKRDSNGFWGLARTQFSSYTIFALNSQRSLTKFKAEYPDARPIYNAVVEYATKTFVPKRQVSPVQVKGLLTYQERNSLVQLNLVYKGIKKNGLLSTITNQDFLEFNVSSTAEPQEVVQSTLDTALEHWSTYVASSDSELKEMVQVEKRQILEKLDTFLVVAGIAGNLPFRMEHYKQIVTLINSIE